MRILQCILRDSEYKANSVFYRFISQMSTVCFPELSFYVLDTEHCLGQTGH